MLLGDDVLRFLRMLNMIHTDPHNDSNAGPIGSSDISVNTPGSSETGASLECDDARHNDHDLESEGQVFDACCRNRFRDAPMMTSNYYHDSLQGGGSTFACNPIEMMRLAKDWSTVPMYVGGGLPTQRLPMMSIEMHATHQV